MDSRFSIVNLFCRDLTRELTIRQISKLIKKSYAHTNQEVWELINKGVINKKDIGKSILCSLNINNDLTKSLLVFNSMTLKMEVKDEWKQDDILFAFYSKNKLIVVGKNGISKQDFKTMAKQGIDFTVVYGHEKYWELIGDIYE